MDRAPLSPMRHLWDEPLQLDLSEIERKPSDHEEVRNGFHNGVVKGAGSDGGLCSPTDMGTDGSMSAERPSSLSPLATQSAFGTFDPDIHAGPSSARRGSIIPEFLPSPAEDSEQVQVHLSHQRRSTIFRRGRRRHSTQDHGSDEGHEPRADADGVGRLEDHIEPHTDLDLGEETAVERAERELMDHEADADARRRMDEWNRDAVKIKAYDTDWNEWGEDVYENDEIGFGDVPAGFAWDVIFENQRGIHIFGKAYFSANSLLPADPSPYTVPSHALPTATSLTLSTPAGAGAGAGAAGRAQRTSKRMISPLSFSRSVASSSHTIVHANPSIPAEHKSFEPNTQINLGFTRDTRTAYTPETAQVPDPSWEWVTPWMINMKTGTDEGGWRYNAWFRKKGWKAHAGTAGWAGWVRRREWVRLRAVRGGRRPDKGSVSVAKQDVSAAEETLAEDEGTSTDLESTHGKTQLPTAFKLKPPDLGKNPVEVLLREMSRYMVDREKLEAWTRWLDDDAFREKARELLDDAETRHRLRDGFTYNSSFSELLVMANIVIDAASS